jgi:hypothetical protein
VSNSAVEEAYERAKFLKDLHKWLLDVLVEWSLAGNNIGMEEPRVSAPDGREFHWRRTGYDTCPDCGGPLWVYEALGEAGGSVRFCPENWQLDAFRADGTFEAHATRRVEKFLRALPPGGKLSFHTEEPEDVKSKEPEEQPLPECPNGLLPWGHRAYRALVAMNPPLLRELAEAGELKKYLKDKQRAAGRLYGRLLDQGVGAAQAQEQVQVNVIRPPLDPEQDEWARWAKEDAQKPQEPEEEPDEAPSEEPAQKTTAGETSE